MNIELTKEFLEALHKEKLNWQTTCSKYIMAKLTALSLLFGIGSIKINTQYDFSWLVLVVPVINIYFDSFIRISRLNVIIQPSFELRTYFFKFN